MASRSSASGHGLPPHFLQAGGSGCSFRSFQTSASVDATGSVRICLSTLRSATRAWTAGSNLLS